MTDIVFILTFLFSLLLSSFMFWCYVCWKSIPTWNGEGHMPNVPLSIVISARDEERNILECLKSLIAQDYSCALFEILIVDDNSTDKTAILVNEFMSNHPEYIIRLIKLKEESGGSKKAALTYGIDRAQFDLIAITDADCIVPAGWIRIMVQSFLKNDARFLAGPVDIQPGNRLSGSIQSLEFMGLVGISAAGISKKVPIMCNGANMLFTKNTFREVGGFESRRTLASGDDTQLLLKVSQKFPGKVFFVKSRDAIVSTSSQYSWQGLFEQRKRWAGKIPFALTPFTISIAIIAWFSHAFLLAGLIISVSFWQFSWLFIASGLMLLICEFILLNSMASFFKRRKILWLFLPLQPFYWIYIVLIGLVAPFGTFRWKGRITR